MKKLKKFLIKHNACNDGFDFAKNLSIERFLNTCERGDWILWLFRRTNIKSLRRFILVKALCVNTIRHLMKDRRSTKAIDIAILYGKNKATKEQYMNAYDNAYSAVVEAALNADSIGFAAAYAVITTKDTHTYTIAAIKAAVMADAISTNSSDYVGVYIDAAVKQHYKTTANICKKYLPLKIWNQSKL